MYFYDRVLDDVHCTYRMSTIYPYVRGQHCPYVRLRSTLSVGISINHVSNNDSVSDQRDNHVPVTV